MILLCLALRRRPFLFELGLDADFEFGRLSFIWVPLQVVAHLQPMAEIPPEEPAKTFSPVLLHMFQFMSQEGEALKRAGVIILGFGEDDEVAQSYGPPPAGDVPGAEGEDNCSRSVNYAGVGEPLLPLKALYGVLWQSARQLSPLDGKPVLILKLLLTITQGEN